MNELGDTLACLSGIKRVDDACQLFEDEWLANRRPVPEDYLAALPAQDRAEGLCELLMLEWDYRTRNGESFLREEYDRKFQADNATVAKAWERWKERVRAVQTASHPDTAPPGMCQAHEVPAILARQGLEQLERVGAGGMGEVWKGLHPRLKRWVAVKVLRSLHASPESARRFRAEAEVLGRLQHPHIVRVHDFAERDGLPALTMEYVAGGTLQERLRGPLSPQEAARLVAVLAWTVHAAHEKGIVHRDLKPANVLMDEAVPGNPGTVLGGFPRIADFGLARMAGEGAGGTLTGAVVGTPAYMSPEQAAGRTSEVGKPTDVWALGVILYRALTGKSPFEGDSVLDTLERVKALRFTPVGSVRADLPAEYATACEACLSKEPASRPTAKQLAEWLDRLGGKNTGPGEPLPLPRQPRHPVWAVAGVGLLAALVVLLGWGLSRGPGLAEQPRQESGEGEELPPFSAPLSVALDVVHYDRDLGKDHAAGLLGVESFQARYDDRVEVQADFSEMAHAYLIGFNFDGKEQLLWPCDQSRNDRPLPKAPPGRVRRLQYPPPASDGTRRSAVEAKLFRLNDDKRGGVQAFVVVASREKLPAYAVWRAGRGAPWRKQSPVQGVWRSSGETLDPMTSKGIRSRGEVVTREGQPPLLELCRWAKGEGVEVEAIAFPVYPRE